jgi:hypothetical protein
LEREGKPMTEQAIEAVTMENAAKALKDKIRIGFAELIPPEQWEAMIKKELDSFLVERPDTDHWGNSRGNKKPSLFHEVCAEVFREHAKAAVKEALARSEWATRWNSEKAQNELGELVQGWLTENADKLFHVVIQQTVGAAAQSFVSQLRGGV